MTTTNTDPRKHLAISHATLPLRLSGERACVRAKVYFRGEFLCELQASHYHDGAIAIQRHTDERVEWSWDQAVDAYEAEAMALQPEEDEGSLEISLVDVVTHLIAQRIPVGDDARSTIDIIERWQDYSPGDVEPWQTNQPHPGPLPYAARLGAEPLDDDDYELFAGADDDAVKFEGLFVLLNEARLPATLVLDRSRVELFVPTHFDPLRFSWDEGANERERELMATTVAALARGEGIPTAQLRELGWQTDWRPPRFRG